MKHIKIYEHQYYWWEAGKLAEDYNPGQGNELEIT